MMQETDTHSRLKQITIIIACLLGAVAVGWGAIIILKTLEPSKNDTPPSQTLSAAETITQVAAADAIAALSTDSYNKQTDSSSEATVIYKSGSATYIINAPAKYSALFSVKNIAQPDDTTTVEQQVLTFMEQRQYKKIDNVGSAKSTNPRFVTYENDRAACQLSSTASDAASSLPGYHKLSCADKTEIQAEYTATDKLLALYKKSNQAAPFTESLRTTQTEGNKSLAVLNLSEDNTDTALLFAAIDENWSYIGSLSDNQAESNGKYAPSPEVRQALSDPKWGDFLTKNIQ